MGLFGSKRFRRTIEKVFRPDSLWERFQSDIETMVATHHRESEKQRLEMEKSARSQVDLVNSTIQPGSLVRFRTKLRLLDLDNRPQDPSLAVPTVDSFRLCPSVDVGPEDGTFIFLGAVVHNDSLGQHVALKVTQAGASVLTLLYDWAFLRVDQILQSQIEVVSDFSECEN